MRNEASLPFKNKTRGNLTFLPQANNMSATKPQTKIYKLSYQHILAPNILQECVYDNMDMHFYWNDDLSAEYYIAQAKAGLIAITTGSEKQKILLPEMQYSYALLDFANLHISRKVRTLLHRKQLQIEISCDLDPVFSGIEKQHPDNWLTGWYQDILHSTQGKDLNFQVVAVALKSGDNVVAGEVGYMTGKV